MNEPVLCPRCEQGVVSAIKTTGEVVQVCEECEALWPASEVPTTAKFDDLTTYMKERGLSALGPELEEVGSS